MHRLCRRIYQQRQPDPALDRGCIYGDKHTPSGYYQGQDCISLGTIPGEQNCTHPVYSRVYSQARLPVCTESAKRASSTGEFAWAMPQSARAAHSTLNLSSEVQSSESSIQEVKAIASSWTIPRNLRMVSLRMRPASQPPVRIPQCRMLLKILPAGVGKISPPISPRRNLWDHMQ